MNSLVRKIGLIGLTLSCLAAPVSAQQLLIGPNGVTVVDPRDNPRFERGPDRRDDRRDRGPDRRDRRDRSELSEREAVRIARREGVRDVDRVSSRRSTYRVEGIDRRGRDIEVTIDRRSGDVLSVR